ncbi:MAG: NAD(+) synthase [Rikenellaceae bacterium]
MKNISEVYNSKIEKLREFFAGVGASKAVIALSGGIDSAVVVPLAVEALGRENVKVVMLPTRFSSEHSVLDSKEEVRRLGIEGNVVSIDGIFEAALEAVSPLFDTTKGGIAVENMQARIRCMVTMALANSLGALMLNTSNRSEILVGYGTLYGDTSGAVGVIGDLYKDEVYALARYINEVQGDVIPENILTKAPSAELSHGQKDSDSLPEYDVLDPILRMLFDQGLSAEQTATNGGYPLATVQRVVTLNLNNSFKTKQLPPLL